MSPDRPTPVRPVPGRPARAGRRGTRMGGALTGGALLALVPQILVRQVLVRQALAFLALVLLASVAPAMAQEAPGAAAAGAVKAPSIPPGPRYAFAPVEGGALKLDTQTGKVSMCAKGPAGFTCEAVPDSRDAYEAEIARLQREINLLKGAGGPNAGTGTAPGSASELEQALDYAERMYRRLRSFIEGLNDPGPRENI